MLIIFLRGGRDEMIRYLSLLKKKFQKSKVDDDGILDSG